jgi:hypothetical protein
MSGSTFGPFNVVGYRITSSSCCAGFDVVNVTAKRLRLDGVIPSSSFEYILFFWASRYSGITGVVGQSEQLLLGASMMRHYDTRPDLSSSLERGFGAMEFFWLWPDNDSSSKVNLDPMEYIYLQLPIPPILPASNHRSVLAQQSICYF